MNKRISRVIAGCISLALLLAALGGCNAAAATTTTTTTTAAAATAAPATTTASSALAGRPAGGMGSSSSVGTSTIKQKWLDVAYATVSAAQKLDIYLPNSGTGPFPVIVAIHGGAYKSGDKSGELSYLQAALDKGYAVVSINYRLSGEAIFPAAIHDVKAAIRFVRANAAKYSLNPEKIAAWGGSAGGGLAALAGTSGGVKALQDDSLGNADQSDKLTAVVDWFGPINFLTMDDQFKASGINGQVHNVASSPESVYLGGLLTAIPETVQKSNPETYITADDPAFFIQHGTADILIPTQQSIDFAAKLTAVLGTGKVTYESLTGAGHGDAAFTSAANIAKVLAFLDTYMK